MAWIQFDSEYRREIDRQYGVWVSKLPRHPNQIGGTSRSSVEGPRGEVLLPDAFVDELERLKIPIRRVR